MARKGWTALSAQYRSRLEKAGITQSDYEAGQSLSKARGHAKTPEHPSQVNPQKHATYYNERLRLIRDLEAKKVRLWASTNRFNAQRSGDNIRQGKVSNTSLKWALNASETDMIDALRQDSESFKFLGYH